MVAYLFGWLSVSSSIDDILLMNRDNLEHFEKLADAQAPKVDFNIYFLLFMDFVANTLRNSFW